jgi:hypothetical protein
MTEINVIHWDDLGTLAWHQRPGRIFVMWPGPVDHDACFAKAGFQAFADTTDPWHAQFLSTLDGLIDALSIYGAPAIECAEMPEPSLLARLFFGKKAPVLRPAEYLKWATQDDNVVCSVAFGLPPAAIAWTTDGHPIVWVWLVDGVTNAWPMHLQASAGDRPIVATALDWRHLLPLTVFPDAFIEGKHR